MLVYYGPSMQYVASRNQWYVSQWLGEIRVRRLWYDIRLSPFVLLRLALDINQRCYADLFIDKASSAPQVLLLAVKYSPSYGT